MTNLLATIIVTFTTNWTTTATTHNTCTNIGCLVYHQPLHHQIGAVSSNIVAVIEWNGTQIRTTLESSITERISRDTYAPSL